MFFRPIFHSVNNRTQKALNTENTSDSIIQSLKRQRRKILCTSHVAVSEFCHHLSNVSLNNIIALWTINYFLELTEELTNCLSTNMQGEGKKSRAIGHREWNILQSSKTTHWGSGGVIFIKDSITNLLPIKSHREKISTSRRWHRQTRATLCLTPIVL